MMRINFYLFDLITIKVIEFQNFAGPGMPFILEKASPNALMLGSKPVLAVMLFFLLSFVLSY